MRVTDQLNEFPTLAPEEHAWVEQLIGRTLSTEEAQLFLREQWVRVEEIQQGVR